MDTHTLLSYLAGGVVDIHTLSFYLAGGLLYIHTSSSYLARGLVDIHTSSAYKVGGVEWTTSVVLWNATNGEHGAHYHPAWLLQR